MSSFAFRAPHAGDKSARGIFAESYEKRVYGQKKNQTGRNDTLYGKQQGR